MITVARGRGLGLTTSRFISCMTAFAAALGCVAAAPADIGVSRVLVDTELGQRTVRVLSLDGDGVRFVHRGDPGAAAFADLLAVLPGDGARVSDRWWPPEAILSGYPAVVQLADGQRLIGYVMPSLSADGAAIPDAIDIAYGSAPALRVPLELIARMIFGPDALNTPAAGALQDDTVLLRNGDRVDGFVVSIGDAVEIEQTSGTVASLPMTSVSEIRLANPFEPTDSAMFWLADGTIISGTLIGDTPGDARLRPTLTVTGGDSSMPIESTIAIKPSDLLAAVLKPGRSIGLSGLALLEERPAGDRRWTPPITHAHDDGFVPQPLGADIELPGPVRAAWALPAGATRFRCTAALGGADSAWVGPWADCVVRVGIATGNAEPTILAEHRLRPGNTSAEILVDLPAGDATRLVIELDPGDNGPIQDRVTLRQPTVLLGP